jgi:hypothetical protein
MKKGKGGLGPLFEVSAARDVVPDVVDLCGGRQKSICGVSML